MIAHKNTKNKNLYNHKTYKTNANVRYQSEYMLYRPLPRHGARIWICRYI